jgi:hypothetical protein
MCPWTHFAGQSATALHGNFKIHAGKIGKIENNGGEKTGTEQK